MSSIVSKLATLCKNCELKLGGKNGKCPMAYKLECPIYQAEVAKVALIYKDTAQLIPVETMVAGLRLCGFSGELRKSSIAII